MSFPPSRCPPHFEPAVQSSSGSEGAREGSAHFWLKEEELTYDSDYVRVQVKRVKVPEPVMEQAAEGFGAGTPAQPDKGEDKNGESPPLLRGFELWT